MRPKYKKVLVTGADGFIGSHLAEELVRRGYHVRAFVLYNSFNSWGWLDEAPAKIKTALEVFPGDIRDGRAVEKAMKDCSAVLHLAALISIPYSYEAPESFIDTNVKGTLNVLEAARSQGVAKFVHTSTSEVYGTARFVPITEEHPLGAQSPYAASKIAADQLALSFHKSFGVPVCVLRPFNTFGPRQSARAIIPTIITQLESGRKVLKLGSLHPTRDFTAVSDTVEGFIAALERDAGIGEVINLGSGTEISIGDLARLVMKSARRRAVIQTDDKRIRPPKSEVERLLAQNGKARSLLGWTPRFAGEEGFVKALETTVAWFREDGHLERYKADLWNI